MFFKKIILIFKIFLLNKIYVQLIEKILKNRIKLKSSDNRRRVPFNSFPNF